jgi:ADP-ribose pyrophosphatase YjhB (NUDIX family)
MRCPQDTYLYKGTRVTNTWIRVDDIEKYSPVTQVYGIIFNNKGEIFVCRESKEGVWIIPGDYPEKGESTEETLKRELLEELDVEVDDIKPLGVQKVTFPDDKDPDKAIYQIRCIAKLKKLNLQIPDPSNGS